MRGGSLHRTPYEGIGIIPTVHPIFGPMTIPRIDYQRIFVLDSEANLLGEYVVQDDCPLEYEDLRRTIPLSGMRHLVAFYQGEYAFTPFRVDGLWFVVLTRGVPRIEDRGSIGTLLAAMRVHLPSVFAPSLAQLETSLRQFERDLDRREASIIMREQRVGHREHEVHLAIGKFRKLEAEVRARESKINVLRDYALQLQTSIRPSGSIGGQKDPTNRGSREPDKPIAPSP